tara:strand:+ start:3145 stop:3651 length:507 start_codon:yes stop_codon:yes gene_type:complete
MANFQDSYKYNIHNDYYTRKDTWELIKDYIPKDKVLWEFCLLNTNEQSKRHLQELGFNVVGDKTIDFFNNNMGDILISNPPFETQIKIRMLKRLVELDKPFIIILNSLNLFSVYFKEIFKNHELYFIIPSKKINYDKYVDGKPQPLQTKCSYYSIFITYKILDKNVWV